MEFKKNRSCFTFTGKLLVSPLLHAQNFPTNPKSTNDSVLCKIHSKNRRYSHPIEGKENQDNTNTGSNHPLFQDE